MFKKDSRSIDVNSTSSAVMETVIGENTTIDGVVSSNSTLRVDGVIKGEIKSSSSVIIGPSGKVFGNVRANQLYIAGNIEGNITVAEKTQLASTGYLKGDMSTVQLVVDEGAAFDGRCRMRNIDSPAKKGEKVDVKIVEAKQA